MGIIESHQARAMVAKKLLYPPNFAKLVRLLTSSPAVSRVSDDAQLKLYSKVLPREFLHYPYFADVKIPPDHLSFSQVEQAQLDYAKLLIKYVKDKTRPVLDSGCGMGGLSRELKSVGFTPVALTPDNSQARYIRAKYPELELVHSKLEDFDVVANRHRFGTVVMSESLQYMDLEQATQVVKHVMYPGGRWIVSDYFRREDKGKSGHTWKSFLQIVDESGFQIVEELDITPNIVPGLGFAHLLASRLAVPFIEFIFDKIEVKTSALFFLLEEVIGDIRLKLADQLKLIEPEAFVREKKYMLIALELRRN